MVSTEPRSLTATKSMSAPWLLTARKKLRPMRPKPLMPTRMVMGVPPCEKDPISGRAAPCRRTCVPGSRASFDRVTPSGPAAATHRRSAGPARPPDLVGPAQAGHQDGGGQQEEALHDRPGPARGRSRRLVGQRPGRRPRAARLISGPARAGVRPGHTPTAADRHPQVVPPDEGVRAGAASRGRAPIWRRRCRRDRPSQPGRHDEARLQEPHECGSSAPSSRGAPGGRPSAIKRAVVGDGRGRSAQSAASHAGRRRRRDRRERQRQRSPRERSTRRSRPATATGAGPTSTTTSAAGHALSTTGEHPRPAARPPTHARHRPRRAPPRGRAPARSAPKARGTITDDAPAATVSRQARSAGCSRARADATARPCRRAGRAPAARRSSKRSPLSGRGGRNAQAIGQRPGAY